MRGGGQQHVNKEQELQEEEEQNKLQRAKQRSNFDQF